MNANDVKELEKEYCMYATRYFDYCQKDLRLEYPFKYVKDEINHCINIVDNKGNYVGYTLHEIYQAEIDKNRMIAISEKLRKHYDDMYLQVSIERGWK